ncbi:MAG: hypothetical protein DM484_10430 [Candidatus Methylumidiphilus alinenensis]|uniref:Uncharacterized protein n=1 Tax=Candidatus Methylumidiphilus alinenensis TaxID=2202197 RepID=A0A2W4T5P1_9GAMM|nr:MAG: hypothetical protein DM484_10430 [Candidatus Methylumidiphilus alinenensis]
MTENIDSLILEHLKGFRNEFKSFKSKYDEDIKDIKLRLTTLERGIGSMKRETADLYEDHARQQAAIDRLTDRIDKIERRLDLSN